MAPLVSQTMMNWSPVARLVFAGVPDLFASLPAYCSDVVPGSNVR